MNFPELHFLELHFMSGPPLAVLSSVREILDRRELLKAVKPGQTVLITAGSWGVSCMLDVLIAMAGAVKDIGGCPLIHPA